MRPLHFQLRVGTVQNNADVQKSIRTRVVLQCVTECVQHLGSFVSFPAAESCLCNGRLCGDVVLIAGEHFLPVVAKMEAQSSTEFTARHNNKLEPFVGGGGRSKAEATLTCRASAAGWAQEGGR